MNHSPEPWRLAKYQNDIEDATGKVVICGLRDVDMQMQSDEAASSDDIKRIIACVNFCRNLGTEDMSGKVLTIDNDDATGKDVYLIRDAESRKP